MPTAIRTLARPTRVEPRRAAAAVFQDEWQVYRKMVDENYLFHREAYAALHDILAEEGDLPFRFLDIACGDASAAIATLKKTAVCHYHGIDLSEPALKLARKAIGALSCPVTLERRDFVTALRDRSLKADIAWIGLSLHHLRTAQKLAVMRHARVVVGDGGKFLVYENARQDGETRADWMERFDQQRPTWRAYTTSEWKAISDHVHANDFPETHVTWLRLGYEAGFAGARCLYISPTDLFRLYCFEA